MLQSPGTLGPHTVLPITISCPVIFSESHQWSEISSLSKWFEFWVKLEVTGHPIWAVGGAKSPGWFDVSLKYSAWDVMHEWVHCPYEAASHQWPIAVAFWIIRIISMKEWPSLTQNLMQIRCSTCSVILNETATQYTCSLNDVYCPHWLEQWSCHCSHMHIPVHSPWLRGYINVIQTILTILTNTWTFSRQSSY